MIRLALIALVLTCAGCASTHKVARDLTVMNDPQEFSLHIGAVENFSDRLRYQWGNGTTKATVRQASRITDGLARLEVRDGTGIIVHSKSLAEQGSFLTAEGKPGVWRISVIMQGATGSVTFAVKP